MTLIPIALFLHAIHAVLSDLGGTCSPHHQQPALNPFGPELAPLLLSLPLSVHQTVMNPATLHSTWGSWDLRSKTTWFQLSPCHFVLLPASPLTASLQFWGDLWRKSGLKMSPSQRSSAESHHGGFLFHNSSNKCQLSTYKTTSNT